MNSYQVPDPNKGVDEQFNRQLQSLRVLENSRVQDLKNKLESKLFDGRAFEELGAFSDSFAKLGQQLLEDRAKEEAAEGIYRARLNGVPEEEQLALRETDREAAEFDGEIELVAELAEASDGHAVVANELRGMSPYMQYAYDRTIVRQKAADINSLWAEATQTAESGGLTIKGADGKPLDFTQIREAGDFAAFTEQFEKLIYKQFAGVSHAVMNEDVFPTMEALLQTQSVEWSLGLAKEQKAERKALNKSKFLGLLRESKDPQAIMDMIRTKQLTRSELKSYIEEGIANGAINDTARSFLKTKPFTHSATGKPTTIAEYLGAEYFNIEKAFSDKAKQDEIDRQDQISLKARILKQQIRAQGQGDANGLPEELFNKAEAKFLEENGAPIDLSDLRAQYSNRSVQEKELIEIYSEKARQGYLTRIELTQLPANVRSVVEPLWKAAGGEAKYKLTEKHLTGIRQVVEEPLKKGGFRVNNASVMLMITEVQDEYRDLVNQGMEPSAAYRQVISSHEAKVEADKKNNPKAKDRQFINNTGYVGIVPSTTQLRDANKQWLERKQDLQNKINAHNADPTNNSFFASGYFTTKEIERVSDSLARGEPSYTPSMQEAANLLGISPRRMMEQFAENDSNLDRTKFKMELPPQIQIIEEQLTPSDFRILNGISSEKRGERVIVQRLGAAGTAPVRGNIQEELDALLEVSQELGIDAADLATIISYESAGTYSPDKWGGHNNEHMGLIQFGPNERLTYGVTEGMTFAEQLRGPVKQYLLDRFAGQNRSTQGATLLDLYRTVLVGNPNGRLDAEDSFGTNPVLGVSEMGPHRESVRRRYGL